MTGALTLSGAPTSDLHAATKLYVDGIAAGINFHAAVKATTTTNLSANYSNGTSGYGATLTADTNRAFTTLDGVSSWSTGERILVKDQTNATQNGIYTLTTVGSGSTPWVLTRAVDADNNPAGELATGDFCFVTSGTTNGSKGFILSTNGTITLGTTNVNYTQFNASEAVTAGSGITKSGATLSIATGAITSDMIADGTIVDADINASAAIAQSKISGLSTSLGLKANIDSPTFTGTVSGITKSMVGLGNVDNTSDANKPVSTAAQTALDLKAPLANPTFTGTVSGITKAMVGLANVDNTSDANKPVSTATQTALDAKLASATAATTYETIANVALKAPLASPTFTGTVNAAAVSTSGNVIVGGNLTVNGTTTTINSTTVSTTDSNIEISKVASPTDVTANGAGITVKGATDKTINWYSSTGSFTSSENIDIASGKTYNINGTDVLTATAVGGRTIPASNIVGLTDTQTLTNKTLTSPTITLPSAGITFSDGTVQTVAGTPSLTPINAQIGSITLGASFVKDSFIQMTVGSANSVTIPTDATYNYPIGASIDFQQAGTGQTSFVAASGVTFQASSVNGTMALKLRGQFSVATALKVAANTWAIFGDLSI
jgi:hypothetical protein